MNKAHKVYIEDGLLQIVSATTERRFGMPATLETEVIVDAFVRLTGDFAKDSFSAEDIEVVVSKIRELTAS